MIISASFITTKAIFCEYSRVQHCLDQNKFKIKLLIAFHAPPQRCLNSSGWTRGALGHTPYGPELLRAQLGFIRSEMKIENWLKDVRRRPTDFFLRRLGGGGLEPPRFCGENSPGLQDSFFSRKWSAVNISKIIFQRALLTLRFKGSHACHLSPDMKKWECFVDVTIFVSEDTRNVKIQQQ